MAIVSSRENPFVYIDAAAPATWTEVKLPYAPRVLMLGNRSAAAGTINFKCEDDFVMGAAATTGGELVAQNIWDTRIIDNATSVARVLYRRTAGANQEFYLEAWK